VSCRGRCRPGAVRAGRMYARSFASRNTHAPRGSGGGEGHIAAVEEMLCPGSLYANGNRVVAQPGPGNPGIRLRETGDGVRIHRPFLI
jgi:hypothetical protein